MSSEVLVHVSDLDAAEAALDAKAGRFSHIFTPTLGVVELPDQVSVSRIEGISKRLPKTLSEEDRMFAEVWRARDDRSSGAEEMVAMEATPPAPISWDTEGLLPPHPPGLENERREEVSADDALLESTNTPTSMYLTGKVAVGIVAVGGEPWQRIDGALKYVSVADDGSVWGVNSSDAIYRRTGNRWTRVAGSLKQVSVGSSSKIWGVNVHDQIYRRDGNRWTRIAGSLKHVSVAKDGTVWGVNRNNQIYRRDGNRWTNIAGSLKQISVGSAGDVWGVNSSDAIYRRTGNRWTRVAGSLKHVAVASDGSVFGVNASDQIYRYIGNDTWQQIPGGLKQVSAAAGNVLWGVNAVDNIYTGGPWSGRNFSSSEYNTVVAEVLEGLAFLASANPSARVTFVYDWHNISVAVAPGTDPNSYEAMEAPWRDAALVEMGFQGSRAGSVAYVESLRRTRRSNWAYVAYFTKYPLKWFGYASGERLVMDYANDGWGPARINQVFAHETGHIFGAADEYGGCGCGVSGHFAIANNNCRNCTSSQVDCLMNANTLSLCKWSQGQLGWSFWDQVAGKLTWVSVAADGTVWGVNRSDEIYRRSGNRWTKIAGKLIQISVGSSSKVWGVNRGNEIYHRAGNRWTRVAGSLKNVSVAADGTVWGVNRNDQIYRWNGASWTRISGALAQISTGSSALIWGVNRSDEIHQRVVCATP